MRILSFEEAEKMMEKIGVDKSPSLRNDLHYLWAHGYETVLSCAGHYNKPAEEAGLSGFPPGATVDENPYLTYIIDTGDSSWEMSEGPRRGWNPPDGIKTFRPSLFYDREQYGPIERKFGPEIPILTWRKDSPL